VLLSAKEATISRNKIWRKFFLRFHSYMEAKKVWVD
jgi:hypothetical protein